MFRGNSGGRIVIGSNGPLLWNNSFRRPTRGCCAESRQVFPAGGSCYETRASLFARIKSVSRGFVCLFEFCVVPWSKSQLVLSKKCLVSVVTVIFLAWHLVIYIYLPQGTVVLAPWLKHLLLGVDSALNKMLVLWFPMLPQSTTCPPTPGGNLSTPRGSMQPGFGGRKN